jgi:type IV secretion system protein VirB5
MNDALSSSPSLPSVPVGRGAASPDPIYLNARQEWNERFGSYVKAARDWKRLAYLEGVILLVLAAGFVMVSSQSKVVPYIARMSSAGEVVTVQRADIADKPNTNEIRAALRSWVIGARTVYIDPLAMKAAIDQTYAETLPRSPAFQKLAEYHRVNNPYDRAHAEAVAVDVALVPQVSDRTWQIEWTETTRTATGAPTRIEQWQATVTVAISPPTDAKQILVNPLGLYVQQFDWSPRLQPVQPLPAK